MRLTQIKLAGFKSFVDPTTIVVPGQLVGIVGPNGCGKSNVIDAVRWVLGESSAKQLRGESMQDVIFSGSADRKPVGRASVELVFDNSLGRLAGPWAQYSEISVKRVVTRDGESSYYINSQHVRRRDVTDIFLGTGLGPRAYSIIEQGMISRIITSRPEELRVFLEEAAGVSKYRERRRETESRLEDTRENLQRVGDILSELEQQIGKLGQQAEVAARYTDLQADLARAQHLLTFTRAREAGQARERHAADIGRAQTQLAAESAKLSEAERLIAELRDLHYVDSDKLATLQGALYEANAQVQQIEQELTFVTENRARLLRQVESLADEAARLAAQIAESEGETRHWQGEREAAEAAIAQRAEALQAAMGKIPQLEEAHAEARATVRRIEGDLAAAQSARKVDEVRESQALKVLAQLGERKSRLKTEVMSLPTPSDEDLAASDAARTSAEAAVITAESALAALEQRLPALEGGRRQQQQQHANLKSDIARAETQLLALQRQQARLEANAQVSMWAARHGLDHAPKLWQTIRVQPGWEDAIEAAFGLALNATCVPAGTSLADLAGNAPPGSFACFAAGTPDVSAVASGLTPLIEKLQHIAEESAGFVADLLSRAFALPEGADPLALARTLPPGGVLIDANGRAHTRHGITFYGPAETHRDLHGVLQRTREIEALKSALPELQRERQALERAQQESEHALQETHAAIRAARAQVTEAKRAAHEAELRAERLRQNAAAAAGRRAQIKAELQEIEAGEAREQAAMSAAQAALAESAERMASTVAAVDQADQAARVVQAALAAARQAASEAERAHQQAMFHERRCQDKLTSLTSLRGTLEQRAASVTASHQAASDELAGQQETGIRARLSTALEQKRQREEALALGRRGMEDLAERLRLGEEDRQRASAAMKPLADRVNELRFKEQEARINEDQFKLQLAEAGADLTELAAQLEKKARSTTLAADIARLQEEIASLGAVNLAALQELNEASARKTHLDAQTADLVQAIETLETAIRRIDRETRDLLQETFDTVNRNFSEMFPSLFGGGTAYLRLTGGEILDAGVQVFAQPPGKKNQSIQLLSGGEKALAALSLVFSLFRLNPAPFCMLDEVDAPLDDANTVRYSELVKRMSDQTQFLFITHNKITMEMANQLVGVTMQEPGVSRIVEVDVDTAMSFSQRDQAVAA
jgi:chromosome segregation protein